jgi:hypothetical protein
VARILAGVLLLCALCSGGLMWLTGLRPSAHVATATKTPSGTPTATLVEVAALHDDFSSSGSGWGNDGAHCFYRDGTYHVAGGCICFAPTPDLSDEVVTADVKQEAGSTRPFYGMVMRYSSEGYYNAFFVDGNGEWMFSRFVNGQRTDIVPYRYTPALREGLNVTNTLKVRTVDSHFEFFINGIKVGAADDTVSAGNYCGIEGNSGGAAEVAVSQFTLAWLR